MFEGKLVIKDDQNHMLPMTRVLALDINDFNAKYMVDQPLHFSIDISEYYPRYHKPDVHIKNAANQTVWSYEYEGITLGPSSPRLNEKTYSLDELKEESSEPVTLNQTGTHTITVKYKDVTASKSFTVETDHPASYELLASLRQFLAN